MKYFPGLSQLNSKEIVHATQDRWNQVPKNVIYVSFKAELSAFDMFMNFGLYNQTETIKTKQDFIRSRTKPLKKAIDGIKLKETKWNSRICSKRYKVSQETLEVCSGILDKDYQSALFLEHDYFNNQGISISFQEGKNSYSEALAGSGEVAIFCLVEQIIKAEKASLILLDEPEVSLHPGAQRKLREFILKETVENKHQVVITSHSPTLIEGLPPKAIKLINRDPVTGNFKIVNRATEEQAFSRLGNLNHKKPVIIVEDDLAKTLTEKAISQLDEKLLETIEVTPYPGGGEIIKQDFINIMTLGTIDNVTVFLDGDKKKHETTLEQRTIPAAQDENLEKLLVEYVGTKLKLPLNGGDGTAQNIKEKTLTIRKAFDIYNEHFFFGNTQTPEELLYEIFKDRHEFQQHLQQNNFKELFKQLALDSYGESTAQSIMYEQKRWIRQIPEDNLIWEDFVTIVAKIIGVATEAEAAA